MYVACNDGKVFRPQKELKGFAKVFLKAGESKEVRIPLDDKAFRYFNAQTDCWEIESANYVICVASSVEDIHLTETIRVEGSEVPDSHDELPSYQTGRIKDVSDEEYAKLLGRPIPDGNWSGELTRNDAICQMYYAKSAPARAVYKLLTYLKNKAEEKGKPDLNILFIYNMPFRAIGKMAGGMVSDKMVDDIVFLVNGHFWRGLGRLIADFFRNLKASGTFKKTLEKLDKA